MFAEALFPSSVARPISCRLSAAALRHNLSGARARLASVGAPARLWAVVKANAYGHGLHFAAQALRTSTDGFALVELENAAKLRDWGITQPILLLEGFYDAAELEVVSRLRLTSVVHSVAQAEALLNAQLPRPLDIALKLNTGMNRLGLEANMLTTLLPRLRTSPQIGAISLMTHFADADGASGIAWQLAAFAKFRALAPDLPTTLANSAGILRYPESAGDWARPGIMLYGSSPFPDAHSAQALGLKPVMHVQSAVISVRDLARGDRVGYGCTFAAPQAMRIATVACGYADGYPRHAPTGTPVLVCGQRTQTVGRVSMDKLAVDISHIPEAGVGSPVVLWGEGLSADEVAAAAGTVSYELFCALAARVPVRIVDAAADPCAET